MIEQNLNVSQLNVGDTFESETYTVTKEEIINFAKQYDPQYFHVDEEKAKESLFGELVSSGWLTASISMRLWIESIEIENGFIGSDVNIKWYNPVKPGDKLKVTSKITEREESESDNDKVKLVFKNKTYNQDDEVVIEQEAHVVGFKNQ